MRGRRCFVGLVAVGLLVSTSCSLLDDQNEATAPGAVVDDGVIADDVPVDLEELGLEALDVDDVIVMQPGVGRPLPDSGPGEQRRAVRHVLSTATPFGRVDLFEWQEFDAEMGSGWMRCSGTAFDSGMGYGCSPLDDPPPPEIGFVGANGSDTETVYELRGPAEATHFVIDSGGQRIAIVAVEGLAIYAMAGPYCSNPPTVESAWAGVVEIELTNPTTMC